MNEIWACTRAREAQIKNSDRNLGGQGCPKKHVFETFEAQMVPPCRFSEKKVRGAQIVEVSEVSIKKLCFRVRESI